AHLGGGAGVAHLGGFGGGMHVGSAAGLGGDRIGRGEHAYGTGVHHAIHHFGRYSPGYYGFYGDSDCYDWYDLHPDTPLPLSCS
ncbi:hypothetical protein H8A99_35530, partial [Bradyrhizobium sp. Arg68]|nr:hypothetical protein [Bradyrhizobium ivorense]